MQPLDKTLRHRLERTIKDARDVAEAAAQAALEQLGVRETNPYSHLNESDRDLRRRLRVHGRQLGDHRKPNGEQATDHLIEKVAYEHWHRMLFARFLAENNLLMYPDPDDPVAVTLEECEDLAADEGAANGWELAARFAARMLPQIFRLDSPVFELVLPPERQQKLERLVAELPPEVFTTSDSLGWVYQFWQAKRKDEVNASEVKIGARELPAVTQLFTEPYMVSFLLDNSLGAWWAARRLTEADLQNAGSEDELRQKASIPGVPLDYLRFVQQEDGAWTPATGTFSGWPEQLADLKTLDPCCGSGHFLVAAFLMLVPIRMERDGISVKEAVDAVLRENIYGLELDQRCVELAAFALALTAWKYPGAGGYRVLPELNVACSGLSISAKKQEWLAQARDNTNLLLALEELYKQFKNAPVLGSLINPVASFGKGSLFELKWEEVGPLLTKALAGEGDYDQIEMRVVAQGIAKAASILASKFDLVITNPPYLKSGNQINILKEFCEKHYDRAKRELATVFILRCLAINAQHGITCMVLPQNWLFLKTSAALRNYLLSSNSLNALAKLGSGAFETITGEVVQAILLILGDNPNRKKNGHESIFASIDSSKYSDPESKAQWLAHGDISTHEQKAQLCNPDHIISTTDTDFSKLLGDTAQTAAGISSFDRPRYFHFFWEKLGFTDGWVPSQSTVVESTYFGGCEYTFLWEDGNGQLKQYMDDKKRLEGYTSAIWRAGTQFWGHKGVLVSLMGDLPSTLYMGSAFDQNTALLVPRNEDDIGLIWQYCQTQEFCRNVRLVDQSIKVTTATLEKIPFDALDSGKSSQTKVTLPEPYSNNPTQWVFHGHLCGSTEWSEASERVVSEKLRIDKNVIHVAVARLLGYRWPAELDASMELADEQREWVNRCEALANFADDDGIVCIPPVRGESSTTDRLLNLLAVAYGDAWSNDTLAALLKSADHAGKTLETWLREKFFTQHCKLFQHRPFIWHIWDGLRDGFAALVNYHKLDAKLLETLIYTYLGDWIIRQKQDIASGVDGAQERLAAAESLNKKLELILEGEAPYDIFVRWKPVEKQPIGWGPDLNDGVRLNIRPFLTVPDVGKRGAGILRDKPNIKWNKDRGKDVESAPWFHKFKGDRINDHHLTLAEKRATQAQEEQI